MVELLLDRVLDPIARENFQKLGVALKQEPVLQTGFVHFDLSFIKAETNFVMSHNLGFFPLDVIQTAVFGSGSVTWNYNAFTLTTISLTVSGTVSVTNPTRVRFFLGRYT